MSAAPAPPGETVNESASKKARITDGQSELSGAEMEIRLDIRPPDMGCGLALLTTEPSLSSHFSMKVRQRLDIASRDIHETLAR